MNIYEREKDNEASQKALTRKLPDAHTEAENDLIEHYGVSGRQAYESAYSLILCLFAGAVLLVGAVVLELITKQ